MNISRKPVTYLLLFLSIQGIAFAGRFGLVTLGFQKFIAYYGLHGVHCFTMNLAVLYLFCIEERVQWEKVVWFTGACILGSTFNELLQFFDPSRVVDRWDVAAQVVGCLAAVLAVGVIGPIDKEENEQS